MVISLTGSYPTPVDLFPPPPSPVHNFVLISGVPSPIELSSYTGPNEGIVTYNQSDGCIFSKIGVYNLSFYQAAYFLIYRDTTVVVNDGGTVMVGSPNIEVDQAARTFTVTVNVLAAQTIDGFSPIGNKTPGAAPFTISAPVASSGLPVTVTVASGPATISGTPGGSYTVTLTGASGTVILQADQTGNADYFPANPKTVTFSVQRTTVFISLSGLSVTYNGSAQAISVSANPGNFTPTITYNGSQTVPTNAGSYTVVATVDTVDTYGMATGIFYINPAAASISLSPSRNVTYDGLAHGLTATTIPSGLALSITYNGSSSVPTESGNYWVDATITDPNYSGTVRGYINIVGEALYYNNALGNYQLSALGNWWKDSVYTIPATSLPTLNNVVYIDAIFQEASIPIWSKVIIGKFSNYLGVGFYNTGNTNINGGSEIEGDFEFWNGAYISDNGQGSPDPGFVGNVTVNYPCPIPMPNLSVTSGYSITYEGYPYAVAVNNQEIALNTIWIDPNFHGVATWYATAPAGGNVSQQNSTSTGWVKEGDDLLLNVAFHSTTSFRDPQITQISVTFVDPSSGSVVLNSSNFIPMVGTNQGTPASGNYTPQGYFSYLFWIPVTSTSLSQLLGDYMHGVNESVNLLGEIQWIELNTSGVGPSTLTQRSQNFTLTVARTLNKPANFQPL